MTGSPVMFRRLRNTGLARPERATAAEIVAHHVAMQAQDYGPAKWAVGQRSKSLSDDDLDRAIADGSIVRTHVMRPTWHFVARNDIRWLLALTGPRVLRGLRSRYVELGLDAKVIGQVVRIISRALEGGTSLTRKELAERLKGARIDTTGQRLPFMLSHCELEAVVASGPRKGKDHTYALMDERVKRLKSFDRDSAIAELVERYLASHGPASVTDMRWWSGLTSGDIKIGLEALGDRVHEEEFEGTKLWSNDTRRVGRPRGAQMLHSYDEITVGYTETRYLADPRSAEARAAFQARSFPRGLVIVDGAIAGHYRRSLARTVISFEVGLYGRRGPEETKAIERDAQRFGRFIGRYVHVDISKMRS